MTVFLAAVGGALFQVVGTDLSPQGTRIVGAVGVLLSAVFLTHHERMYDYALQARSHAQEAAGLLGIHLYGYKKPRLVHAGTMSRLLYVASGVLFLWVAVFAPSGFRTSKDTSVSNTTVAPTSVPPSAASIP
jgi:hypothetical protein